MKIINSKVFLIVTFISLFISHECFSQIQILESSKSVEVGKLKAGYITIAELSYNVNESDTVYTMFYRNAKFTQLDSYESFIFSGVGNTIDVFYDLMQKAIKSDNPKEYEVSIKLGNESLIIKGYKTLGIKGVQFLTAKGWLAPINESQLNKLFGK